MSDEILYLHCKKGAQSGKLCKLDALVFEGDLFIACAEHGPVHMQPYVGPPLRCEGEHEGEQR